MSKKDFVVLFSVFAMTGSAIYSIARQTKTTPVTSTQEARTRAEKEFKRSAQNSKVQILKIEQLHNLNSLGEGWLVYHSAQVHKNQPLFIRTDGSMEYVNDHDYKKPDRETSSVH
ncbi:MAG: hypothetical protein H7235_03200 [Bdellovibrionaceae bacterium]|nr:hypothetical protein [Pseudobdellovibrionaceae bacterium]